ncbi:hypothetical protein FB451DRAFT_1167175 [Mycena latifolia]|nr:hypothetical protein FB451DRAFT_1167175 [Mycena latifolia]
MVIQHYRMPEWFANTLSAIVRQRQMNQDYITWLDGLSQANMPYDPITYASWLQYREFRKKGCPLVGECFTLNMRLVQGSNLFELLTMECESGNAPTKAERECRIVVERAILEVVIMPGLYAKHTNKMGWMIADTFAPQNWSVQNAREATVNLAIESMAAMGIPINYIDDAWLFARTWVREIASLASNPQGHSAAGRTGGNDTLFPRHPVLPWKTRAEQLAHYEVFDWRHPSTNGLKREENSCIQSLVKWGMALRRGLELADQADMGVLACLNPFKGTKAVPKDKGKAKEVQPAAPPPASVKPVLVLLKTTRAKGVHPSLRNTTTNAASTSSSTTATGGPITPTTIPAAPPTLLTPSTSLVTTTVTPFVHLSPPANAPAESPEDVKLPYDDLHGAAPQA